MLTVCLGKSTYARCGIIVNVTPFEPEWEGHVTIEISNTTPLPAQIYANEGIAQVLFFQSDEACEVSYTDKKGKYQAQRGVTLPKIMTFRVDDSGRLFSRSPSCPIVDPSAFVDDARRSSATSSSATRAASG